jgi:hypothetical protein
VSQLLWNGKLEEAFQLITPEIAAKGLLKDRDLLSYFASFCGTESNAIYYTKRLFDLGYCQHQTGCYTRISTIISNRWWALLYLLETKHVLPPPYGVFDYFSAGNMEKESEYRAFRSRALNARNASIALIGVGKQLRVLDAMRVIARVVWSNWQLEEGWETPAKQWKKIR